MKGSLFGVQKQTTNSGGLLELSKWPLSIYAIKNCIKNWERIAVQKRANDVTKSSYEWAVIRNSGREIIVKEYLARIGLLDVFLESHKAANVNDFNFRTSDTE